MKNLIILVLILTISCFAVNLNINTTTGTTQVDFTELASIEIVVPTVTTMILVNGGTFQMGTGDSYTGPHDEDEHPQHSVTLNSFYISNYEVTQAEWVATMGVNPSYSITGDFNKPVEQVCWYDVLVYCNKRSIAEGLTPVYTINGSTNPTVWGTVPIGTDSNWDDAICNWSANGYRMPTEAEWEFAARGGNSTHNYTYSGSNNVDSVAWYDSNSWPTTHTVGTKAPNELGIYDMSGNVEEWNWDRFGVYTATGQTNPHGATTGSYHILRGGHVESTDVRSANRQYFAMIHFPDTGFRLCRSNTNATPISVIGISKSSLAFGNLTVINTASAEQTFKIWATDLTDNLSLAAPIGYEISKTTNTGFAAILSYEPVSGRVDTSTVFVRFKPTTIQSNDGNIICTSSGAATRYVAVSGAGAALVPTMVLVNGGTFQMGDGSSAVVHSVTLSSFYIGNCELTQAEWLATMGTNPLYFTGDLQKPVEKVNWYDVLVYCNKRSIAESLTPVYTISGSANPSVWGAVPTTDNYIWNSVICNWSANGYRMPTEAEWEFAARGGNNSNSYIYSGSNTIGDVAWYYNNNSSNKSHSVGTKAANELGIFDMSGNVFEWNWDWNGVYTATSQTNPHGSSTGTGRVNRGGSYSSREPNCRIVSRMSDYIYGRYSGLGLRLARTP